jgi:hypothetical protein
LLAYTFYGKQRDELAAEVSKAYATYWLAECKSTRHGNETLDSQIAPDLKDLVIDLTRNQKATFHSVMQKLSAKASACL